MVGAATLALTTPDFTLHWTHSVEKIEWVESYRINGPTLTLTRAAIKGSGAGMEPADDARLENGWWVWNPMTELSQLRLAASGATGGGWQLCTPECDEIGRNSGQPITLKPCP